MLDHDICPRCGNESAFNELSCPYCGYDKNCCGCEYFRGIFGGSEYCAKGHSLKNRCYEYQRHISPFSDD